MKTKQTIDLSKDYLSEQESVINLESDEQEFTAWETLNDELIAIEIDKNSGYSANKTLLIFEDEKEMIDYIVLELENFNKTKKQLQFLIKSKKERI